MRRYDNPKILKYSFLGFFAIAVLTQYEIREYLRYIPSNYWPLKFVLQYGIAAVFIVISIIGGVRLFIKHKSLLSSIPLIILFVGLICVWTIRQQTTIIEYDNIVLKNDLYVDLINDNILNGTYKSPSAWDAFGDGKNCEKVKYSNGIPVGKWMDSNEGYLIHFGVYLEEQELKKKLILLTNSKRVDIDLWEEADYPYLTIKLINPIAKDSITIEKAIELSIQSLNQKYQFKTLKIESVTKKGIETLKDIETK